MTTIEIIGNILTGIGMTFFFLSSFFKTNKKKICGLQIGCHTFNYISEILMRQYTGLVQDVVSIVRNMVLISDKNNRYITFLLIGLGLGLGITCNCFLDANNPWGYLPIFASFQYSVVTLFPKVKIYQIKLSMMVSSVCWAVYGFVFSNYAMAIFNIVIALSCLYFVIKYFLKPADSQNN